MTIKQFPHCDARVLHAPNECEYCDRHPDWQELRQEWMVAFTGHPPVRYEHGGAQVPCPADFNRPPDTDHDHRRWAGNVASTSSPVNESAASKMLYGDYIYPDDVPKATADAAPPKKKGWWFSHG